ncbi:MAG TPA: P-II family nitrogen regulator [Gemmataceae bacterium]|nr:P-II family nitrogen regulator [Gemmataceae bacterium]
MKLIIAIIRTYHLEAVQAAVERQNVTLTCVSEVLGGGRESESTLIYRDRVINVRKPKYRLEMIVDDYHSDEVVDVIRNATRSGCPGEVSDARIMVMQVDRFAPCGLAARN